MGLSCLLLSSAGLAQDGAPARTIVVSQDGFGAYSEIQMAIDNAKPGDTILIKAGNYQEDVVVHSKNRLRLVGETRDRVTIQGLKRVGAFRVGKWPYGADDIEIRDLTISENGGLAVGIFNGTGILLSNIRVRGLLYVQQATGVKIERSFLGGSETTGVSFADAQGELNGNDIRDNDYGVTIAGKSDVRVEGNVIANNQYEGIVIQAGAKGTIVHNTIIKSGGGIKVQDGARAELIDNIISSVQ
jgi:parallel beta-helix repeat protein